MLLAMVTMNISLDDKAAQQLEELAKESGKPAGELAAEAVRALLARKQYLKAVDEGLEDVKAGRVVDFDQGFDQVRDKLAKMKAVRDRET